MEQYAPSRHTSKKWGQLTTSWPLVRAPGPANWMSQGAFQFHFIRFPKQMKSMAWKWNRRTLQWIGWQFQSMFRIVPVSTHTLQYTYIICVCAQEQKKYSQTARNQFRCENEEIFSYGSNGKKYFVVVRFGTTWTRTRTHQPTMERSVGVLMPLCHIWRFAGNPAKASVRLFAVAQQGGLIHLHGIPLNVAEKSNEARTQVVLYSSPLTHTGPAGGSTRGRGSSRRVVVYQRHTGTRKATWNTLHNPREPVVGHPINFLLKLSRCACTRFSPLVLCVHKSSKQMHKKHLATQTVGMSQ